MRVCGQDLEFRTVCWCSQGVRILSLGLFVGTESGVRIWSLGLFVAIGLGVRIWS